MIDVILDFNDRSTQIDKYLKFIWIIDNSDNLVGLPPMPDKRILFDNGVELKLQDIAIEGIPYRIDSELVKILKSNTLLLLYNLIEGTISALMNEFFSTISSESKTFDEFEFPVKRIWLNYKHRLFSVGQTKKEGYIIDAIENIINESVVIVPKSITDHELGTRTLHNYEAYIAETQSNEISGNLDARQIRILFELYGLPVLNPRCDAMLRVKNKRNSLAHGNETFAQVGSNFTVEELFRMKHEITGFIEHLLNSTKDFIRDKKYLKTPPVIV
ncbi:MAE_28990/MAE_18760 family HEPN-like nuclease [Hymenobacter siberiensis]|uniref:MAE_28990/MAE_18760 family HEPN-like nuclease n=1 Tax=Hymenobacter siberiensis TaxID=2848396 RepID=UPI001C1E5650|nr:MAE_28990/MAE_18760 family HEPN-like nuclease [Hymenobacter siberiensis]